jgi:hypothetical protein
VRLNFEFETGSGRRRKRKGTDPEARTRAWDRIVAEHLRSAEATPEKYDAARKWVGGAVVVYALMVDRDPAEVLAELERDHPLPSRPQPSPLTLPEAMAVLKPGRSTPPPPVSPGAQRAVPVDAGATSAD